MVAQQVNLDITSGPCSLCNGSGVSPGSRDLGWTWKNHPLSIPPLHRALYCPWCRGSGIGYLPVPDLAPSPP